jgi:hypothetical protein
VVRATLPTSEERLSRLTVPALTVASLRVRHHLDTAAKIAASLSGAVDREADAVRQAVPQRAETA